MDTERIKFLSPEELRNLSQPSDVRSLLLIFMDWGLVFFLFWLAVQFPHPVVYLVCFLGIVRQQHAFLILLHEATHQRVFSSPWANRYFIQILFGSPMCMSLESYRKLHMVHHRAPLAAEDPDLPLTGGYPISKASLRRKLIRDLTGRSYIKTLMYFNIFPEKKTRRLTWASYLLANALLLGGLIWMGNGWLYLLWVIPWFTLLPVCLRVRGIAEHAGYVTQRDQTLCTRTVLGSWQTVLLSPHHVNYHVEHHLYPSVPHFRLPQLHRILARQNAIPATQIASGYGEVVAQLSSKQPI